LPDRPTQRKPTTQLYEADKAGYASSDMTLEMVAGPAHIGTTGNVMAEWRATSAKSETRVT
jgi:hypothetical protein